MVTRGHDASAWLLVVIVATAAAPWLVGIVWALRHGPRDGALPLSLGELARRRRT